MNAVNICDRCIENFEIDRTSIFPVSSQNGTAIHDIHLKTMEQTERLIESYWCNGDIVFIVPNIDDYNKACELVVEHVKKTKKKKKKTV